MILQLHYFQARILIVLMYGISYWRSCAILNDLQFIEVFKWLNDQAKLYSYKILSYEKLINNDTFTVLLNQVASEGLFIGSVFLFYSKTL